MFSTTSQYALRALVQLAREPVGVSVLGQEIAKRANIPANYLAKILWTLRNAGLLETTRGHGGGYRLAKPADTIKLIEIVRHFEGVISDPGCLLGEQHDCSDKTPCSAHPAWKKVKEAYIEFICATTLADIGQSDTSLADVKKRPRKRAQPDGRKS